VGKTVRIEGEGKGEITEVKIAGFPQKKPIILHLHGQGGRLRFGSPTPAVQSLLSLTMPDYALTVPVSAEAKPDRPWSAIDAAARLPDLAAHGLTRLAGMASKALDRVGEVVKPRPGDKVTYLDTKLSLEDIDLKQFVERLELKLPFAVAGKLSFAVEA